MDNRFFDETREQSKAKAAIVSKYFWAWAKVIIPTAKKGDNRIAYIDLFAGPGRYKDGTKSTPLLVLEKALDDADMREMLVTLFNDGDEDNSESLSASIAKLPGIERLKHQPEVRNKEVGEEIVREFEGMRLVPTLFFVDPWGYKGLSLRLVNSVLKDWGCDCIFFFNYNRINMGLRNPVVEEHMDALFGTDRAASLRGKLEGLTPTERELQIIEEIASALKSMGGNFVLPFRFLNEKGQRTTHHLIFVSKHFRGYEIMKQIMANESTGSNQGVASFEYSPADMRQPLLFELSRPLDALQEQLSTAFAGQKRRVQDIYADHSVDRPFVLKNYKQALMQMEEKGLVSADPPSSKRRKGTMADHIVVSFPKR